MIRHPKLFFADVHEIIERVSRDAILFWVGALQYQFGEPGFLFPAEMAWTAGPVSIIESVEALSVLARGGIAQRLPIHACATRRLVSALAFQRARNCIHARGCARRFSALQSLVHVVTMHPKFSGPAPSSPPNRVCAGGNESQLADQWNPQRVTNYDGRYQKPICHRAPRI